MPALLKQEVEPGEARLGRGEQQRAHLIRIAHVGRMHEARVAAERGRLLKFVGSPAGEHHGPAGGVERESRRPTDPDARAGDECDPCHRVSPS